MVFKDQKRLLLQPHAEVGKFLALEKQLVQSKPQPCSRISGLAPGDGWVDKPASHVRSLF